MKHKVAYNGCYGGFGLSKEAVLLARELSGDPQWAGIKIKGDKFGSQPDAPVWNHENPTSPDSGFPRHDPVLIKVIEELGKRADGGSAFLCIEEIEGNKYRIDEYDGNETVVVPNEEEWTVIA